MFRRMCELLNDVDVYAKTSELLVPIVLRGLAGVLLALPLMCVYTKHSYNSLALEDKPRWNRRLSDLLLIRLPQSRLETLLNEN